MFDWLDTLWSPLGAVLLVLWLAGAVSTVLSFINNQEERPKRVALLSGIGFVLKLPVYILLLVSMLNNATDVPDFLILGALVLADAAYVIHTIIYAIKHKDTTEEQKNG